MPIKAYCDWISKKYILKYYFVQILLIISNEISMHKNTEVEFSKVKQSRS